MQIAVLPILLFVQKMFNSVLRGRGQALNEGRVHSFTTAILQDVPQRKHRDDRPVYKAAAQEGVEMGSVIETLCDLLSCSVEALYKKCEENRKLVYDYFAANKMCSAETHQYVSFEGLTHKPADNQEFYDGCAFSVADICAMDGFPLSHPYLPCIISKHSYFRRYYLPLEHLNFI